MQGNNPPMQCILRRLNGDIEDLAAEFEEQHQSPPELTNRKYCVYRPDRRIDRVYA